MSVPIAIEGPAVNVVPDSFSSVSVSTAVSTTRSIWLRARKCPTATIGPTTFGALVTACNWLSAPPVPALTMMIWLPAGMAISAPGFPSMSPATALTKLVKLSGAAKEAVDRTDPSAARYSTCSRFDVTRIRSITPSPSTSANVWKFTSAIEDGTAVWASTKNDE